MSSTLKLVAMNTVPANYSWDDGFPDQMRLIALSALSASSSNTAGIEYVGYAPFVSVLLSSANTPKLSSIRMRRMTNFGDYYNSNENTVVVEGSSNTFFSHVYIMPGLYSISLSEEEYVIAPNPAKLPKNSYSQSSSFAKEESLPNTWHWKDYMGVTDTDIPNTWKDLQFQETLRFKKPKQLKWIDAKNCLIENLDNLQTYWQWSNVVCVPDKSNKKNRKITWNESVSGGSRQKTWNSTAGVCTLDEFVLSSASVADSIIKENYIRVIENPPTAYLSAGQPTTPSERVTPLQVRLTPRFTQTGSFPIERIVWDLGDGSPLIARRRWETTIKLPFVYTGTLSGDPSDPRNFDVIHIYERTKDTGFSFYPSITAYASSTNTQDVASCVVGPLKARSPLPDDSLVVTQNEILETGAVYIGEFGDTAAIWRNN